MDKRIIKILIILFLSLILAVLAFYSWKYFQAQRTQTADKTAPTLLNATNTPVEMMTAEEKKALGLNARNGFAVVSRDKDGKITAYKSTGAVEAQPLNPEWMTDADKIWRRLATSTRVQILERDSAGKITAFKIIKSDSDIVPAY